jgi:hypothetical protein
MKAYGYGYGIPFSRVLGGIDPQAQAYYDRVIADGGIVSVPLTTLSDYFKAVKQARGQSDINNCFLSSYHAPFGLKLAAGTGATAGNRACEKLYNLIGTTNDAEQTAPANQPLALVHSGENYVWLPKVAGNFFNSPNSAASNLRNDFEIIAYNVNIFSISGDNNIYGRFDVGQRQFIFGVNPTGNMYLTASVDGANNLAYNSTLSLPSFQNIDLKVTRNISLGEVKFFYNIGSGWVQLGTTISATTSQLFNSTSTIQVGSYINGNLGNFGGSISRITVSNTIGGAPIVDFNPASYNRATSQTTWTSTTGEVWTLNTAATNNALKAAIVDQTMIMGNGTSYGLRAANLNINQTAITSYTAFRKFVNTAGGQCLKELGTNYGASSGFAYFINNFTANAENFGINSNVGLYTSNYTETNLGLKLAAAVNNINNANEASPLLINNVAATFLSAPLSNNNTAAMNATGYNLLARNNAASNWANAILVGEAICAGEDSGAVQTAMWDIYKTLLKIA